MRENDNNNDDFFKRVYEIVDKIPIGKVTTYGAIAQALGLRSSARMVGWALNSLKGDMSKPAHRVVNRCGELTGKNYFATPTMMRELLESEGVEFIDTAVNLQKHLWEPKNE